MAIGWLLGAQIGIGTVISTFGIGMAIQFVFRLARFDVTRVQNESLPETCRSLARLTMK